MATFFLLAILVPAAFQIEKYFLTITTLPTSESLGLIVALVPAASGPR